MLDKIDRIEQIVLNRRNSNKISIISKNIEYSYLKLSDRILCFSSFLYENTNNKIAILIPNCIEFVIAYFSVLYANKTILILDSRMKNDEILSSLEYCKINTIITDNDGQKRLEDMDNDLNILNINLSKTKDYRKIDNTKINDNDIAVIYRTSGSTGSPKYVVHSHKSVIENVKMNVESLFLKENDKTLVVLPLSFSYANNAQLLSILYLGGVVCIEDLPMHPKYMLKVISKRDINVLFVVPTILKLILPFVLCNKELFDSVKSIICGGAKLDKLIINQMIEIFPNIDIFVTYGLTEAGPRVCTNHINNNLSKISSVGLPMSNIKITIQNKKNEIGDIVIDTPSCMIEYLDNKALTSFVLHNNLLHTGDIGYLDSDGYLYIIGRKKNIIISGGQNIYPEDVEEVIGSMKGIKEVIVYSKKDNVLGEIIVANIVANNISKKDVVNYCRRFLADYKIPKQIYFVDNIDKTINGKLKRYNV